ncbi:MAG: DUF6538 domain-containing protein, partial [Burkholderiaceae bacterium]
MTRNPAKIRLSGQSGVYKTVYTDMDQYLKQRQDGKSETYYLTYPVPTELQELVGRRYERKSTGTTNLRDARRVAAELVALYERKYQLLYAQITSTEHDVKKPKSTAISATLSEKLISTLCEAWRATHLKSDDRERDEGIDSTDLEDIQAYARAIEIDARELLALGRNAASFAHVCEEACDWAETLGYLIAQNDPSIAIYIRKFAAEKFEVAKALVARNKGEPVLTPDLPAHFKGLTLAEYKPHWLGVHIKGLAQKTKVGYSGRVDQFIRFLNLKFPELDNAPLRAIEGRHIQAYASYLLNDEELHPGTIVDGHLPAIRSCFQYAFSDGHTIANPCMNVKL